MFQPDITLSPEMTEAERQQPSVTRTIRIVRR